jgi:CRP-like cAMP-binding protein
VATAVTMPQLGETVVEGTIVKWLKSEGDPVERDEPLFEISTDKVDTEVPSPVAGTLQAIKVQEGETVSVGTELAMIEEGSVVGQTGFAVRRSRALRLEALQPSTLLVLRWEDFEELVFRNPEVGIKTIRLLSERLAVSEGRLSDLIRNEVVARLAGLILSLSEHQGIVTGDGSRRIPTRYTHQLLASMVGSNREAITRALGRLRKAGAVEIRDRHIYVTDADELERYADARR